MIESEKRQWLIDHLRIIAALDDKVANDLLAATGSYRGFDEPGSVKIAREVLSELGVVI